MIESQNLKSLTQNEERYRRLASVLSLVVGILLMILKFWAHNITGSQAVFSDALESIVNVVAAGLAIFVLYYSAKPADQDHPYGHGKVEYFSAAFEGGLIAFAAVFIAIEAIRALIQGEPLSHLDIGFYIVMGAGIANFMLGMFLIYVGKKTKSVALKASGHHVTSDFWTSVGVAVGLLVVQFTGMVWLDSILALIVGVYLGYTGIKLVRESIAGLMDEEDINVLKSLATIFKKHASEGIIQIHHVKVIRSGWYHHIDAHLVLPEFWDVTQVHDKVLEFEMAVIRNYEYGGEMNFHIDPCRQAYCRACDVKDCPIRQHNFQEKVDFDLTHLRSQDEPEEYR